MHLKKQSFRKTVLGPGNEHLIDATARDDLNRQVFLWELCKLNLELAAAIDELTFTEEQIIEHKLEDVSTVGNKVGTMINASIRSKNLTHPTNNTIQQEVRLIDTRMILPSPTPFQGSNVE